MLQFISLYNQRKNDTADELQWGDEIEYQLIAFDDEARVARIALRAEDLLATLSAKEQLYGRRDGFGEACSWHPEYGGWMIEGTPRFPYSGFTADLRRVETNMILRRTRLAASLGPGEAVLSIPAFPTLGTSDFCAPAVAATDSGEIAASTALPDAVINRNPRFHTLTRNIRLRRGSNVDARIPLYRDARTPAAELASGIRMDAMGYGMGCCCLQAPLRRRPALVRPRPACAPFPPAHHRRLRCRRGLRR